MTFHEAALLILGKTGNNKQNLRDLEHSIDKLVPFVGAGLSAVFNYPNWKPFLQGMAGVGDLRATVDDLLSRDQYEEAAEALAHHLGRKFDETIRLSFGREKLKRPLDIGASRHLPDIARGPVLTTNFDQVLEAAFDDRGWRFTAVYPGDQIADANKAIQLRERVLLKLHGDYDTPFFRVLTLSQYRQAYGGTGPGQIQWELPLPRVLRQAIGANPLLFLGCSLNADRTTAIIAEVAKELPGIVHFALLSDAENTSQRCAQLEGWKIKPLFFPARRFEKIDEFLACLAEALSPRETQTPPTVKRRYLTSFVGRRDELETLNQLVRSRRRLITITGPAGSGKTRLAVELIERVASQFAGGVYFVPLDQIGEHTLVFGEIAGKLGIRDADSRRMTELGAATTAGREMPRGKSVYEVVEEYLSDRHVLLILDNFEHVIEAAPRIAGLAAACSRVCILVTSRERLRVQGEEEVSVGPLLLPDLEPLPGPDSLNRYSAVALFVARAQAALPGFAVTAENARTVVTICHKLDGLPLAIELAAAKLRWYSAESLLSHLEDRLTFLAQGARDLPKRLQTLRDAIAWSYQLLGTAEQKLIRSLSVFAGSFDAETVAAVCRPADDGLATVEQRLESLADKSLLQRLHAPAEPRYRMLGVIQEFALELLVSNGEAAALREQYSQYFVEAVQGQVLPRLSDDESAAQKWFNKEIGNLRGVFELCGDEHHAWRGLRLAVSMRPYWLDGGHVTEGRQRLAKLLDLDRGSAIVETKENVPIELLDPWRTDALQLAALLASAQNDYESARVYLEELKMIGDQSGSDWLIESAIGPLSMMSQRPADADRLKPLYDDLLQTYRALGNERGEVRVLLWLAATALRANNAEIAKRHLQNGLTIADRLGDWSAIGALTHQLAAIAALGGDRDESLAMLKQSVNAARRSGGALPTAMALVASGQALVGAGDVDAALSQFQEASRIGERTGNTWIVAHSLFHLGRLALQQGNFDAAQSYLERAERISRDLGSKSAIADTILALAQTAAAQGRIPKRLPEAIALFRDVGNRVGQGAVLITLAEGDLNMSKYEEAIRTFGEARRLFEASGDQIGVANTAIRTGHAYRERGDYEQAQKQYEEALGIFKSRNSNAGIANSMRFIGDLYRRQKNFVQAKKQYEDTVAFCREAKDQAGEASTLLALGDLHMDMKE